MIGSATMKINLRNQLMTMSLKPPMTPNWNKAKYKIIFCCPLLLLLSIFPSIRVFSNELALHIRWPKYWSFNFSISASNEPSNSGLISFRIDWLDLLAVQGFLGTIQKHHFFGAQPSLWSNSHIHTGKTIALSLQTFFSKVTLLLFNAV